MQFRLEKINHVKRQQRFYELSILQTLFGEWCLRREWGRLGSSGGQQMREYFETHLDALRALQKLKQEKTRRGYATIPVQLSLFEVRAGGEVA